MKKTQRFKLANQGTFQILTSQELKTISRYELHPPGMPDILFIRNGWSIKNRSALSKPLLHARLRSTLDTNRN